MTLAADTFFNFATMTRRLRQMANELPDNVTTGGVKSAVFEGAATIERAIGVRSVPDRPLPGHPPFDQIAKSMVANLKEQDPQPTSALLSRVNPDAAPILSGNSRAVSFEEFLEFLCVLSKSGVVWVNSATEKITIEIHSGVVVHAASDHSPPGSRLGDVLVAKGFVSQEQLEEFLLGMKSLKGRLGVELEINGLISHEQLEEALTTQIEMLFERAAMAESTTFAFSPRPIQEGGHRVVRLDVRRLLLENARQRDERARDDALRPESRKRKT